MPEDIDAVAVLDEDVFDPEEEDLNPTQIRIRARQVAVLFCCGHSMAMIAEQINTTAATARKYFKSEDCQKDIAKIQNSDLNLVRSRLRDVLPKMCERLIEDIEENTPEAYKAIKIVSQIFGFTEHRKPVDTPVSSYQLALQAILAPNDPKTEDLLPDMKLLPGKSVSVESKTDQEDEDEDEEDTSEVEF